MRNIRNNSPVQQRVFHHPSYQCSAMSDQNHSGDPLGMTAEAYHTLRNQRRGWRYRRRRQAEQVLEALRHADRREFDLVLDVGVADGLTL